MGLRKPPNVFTERGVAMLSSVLNSETAIEVNIQIIRTFTCIRQMLSEHTELRLEVEKIKKKLDNQDKNMEVVFQYLDELLEKKDQPKVSVIKSIPVKLNSECRPLNHWRLENPTKVVELVSTRQIFDKPNICVSLYMIRLLYFIKRCF
jgi:hypothetical protein